MRSHRRAAGGEAELRLQAALGERPRTVAGPAVEAGAGLPRGAAPSAGDGPVAAGGGGDPAPGGGAAAVPGGAVPSLAEAAAVLRSAAARRLPEPVRDGVLDPRPRGAWTLAAVVLLAAVVAGALVLRARPVGVPVAPPRLEQSPGGPPSASPQPALVVDVAGAVRRPGLQRLPAGSRVADAIRAAGGVRRGTSTTGLNLARKLIDGEQVVVGGRAPGGGPAGASAPAGPGGGSPAGGPVNLNTATVAELDTLTGVGPVTAQRIVEWREAHGGFTSVEQLQEVDGIGERRFASLRAQVTV